MIPDATETLWAAITSKDTQKLVEQLRRASPLDFKPGSNCVELTAGRKNGSINDVRTADVVNSFEKA